MLSLMELAGKDLSRSFKGYGENVEDAALNAGTISRPYRITPRAKADPKGVR
ncbi:hypothetical protein [Streptomyces sp. NPDC092952]|uniref:hypothetical protein n=1 Tax=Streptomyces sp. NPDC092952 TaxID=3366018 RepID=UPI00380033B9